MDEKLLLAGYMLAKPFARVSHRVGWDEGRAAVTLTTIYSVLFAVYPPYLVDKSAPFGYNLHDMGFSIRS